MKDEFLELDLKIVVSFVLLSYFYPSDNMYDFSSYLWQFFILFKYI